MASECFRLYLEAPFQNRSFQTLTSFLAVCVNNKLDGATGACENDLSARQHVGCECYIDTEAYNLESLYLLGHEGLHLLSGLCNKLQIQHGYLSCHYMRLSAA